jgi:beta-N-acetylhexosaminidase
MRLLFALLLFINIAYGDLPSDTVLQKMVGRMLIVGFDATEANATTPIAKDIARYDLGGVILFDKEYKDRNKTKNIASLTQLHKLTHELRSLSKKPLFIAVDQEGGRVARLKPKYGFSAIPSAKAIAKLSQKAIRSLYAKEAAMLQHAGINMNFAPVLDLAVEPKNRVIYQLERSYGSDPKKVAQIASILIDAQNDHHIISVAKHFPGHGSSLADSHKGFVDITKTWSKKELQPYKILIQEHKLDAIMTAHVFNKNLDPHYPATLSKTINQKLLRDKLAFRGVIISDDMQMKAIAAHYTLKEATTLAINAGVDILLFGNQLDHTPTATIINTIVEQIKAGKIPLKRIQEANERIANLHTKERIIQKPILFKKERIAMTKAYIKKHYGIDKNNIKIVPKMIVLHWTAEMDFNRSYHYLYPQKLRSARKDIAAASALNVSAHYLIDRDGTIYQLMPDNWMARHVIGLNYSAIGVENVGGEANKKEDLTPAQVAANRALVRYLKEKYPTIAYLIGHYEYREMENNPLWLERDKGYRTIKADPGKKFMKAVRAGVADLHLKGADE